MDSVEKQSGQEHTCELRSQTRNKERTSVHEQDKDKATEIACAIKHLMMKDETVLSKLVGDLPLGQAGIPFMSSIVL